MTEEEMIKGYKGFKKGLVCRDKQYAENTVFTEESSELCKSGMHFCKNPLCVLEYYPYYNGTDFSEYAAVEAVAEKTMSDDTKSVTKELHIGKKICFEELIDCGISYILNHATDVNTTMGNYSASTNTGDYSASTNTGYYSASTNTGYCSASLVTGNYSKASTEKNSISIALGIESYAKSEIGGYIVLTECAVDGIDNKVKIVDCKCFKVDGNIIKADTYYTLCNGIAKEMEEETAE